MEVTIWFWIIFNIVVVGLLLVDLLVLQKDAHEISTKEAAFWSAFWIALSLLFCLGLYFYSGSEIANIWLTAYVVEKALSVDNIFVFVMIFLFFNVEAKYQHRVLFWGILGAIVMRAVLIIVGGEALAQFPWLIYVFGAFLLYTGIRMGLQNDDEHIDLENNVLLRWLRKYLPMTQEYHGSSFFIMEGAKRLATPLFLVLVIVELIDLVFAVDSIPAVLGVAQVLQERDDGSFLFVAYTSNIAAILGLRALYFLLASIVHKFRYLQLGLAIILTFVGVKMIVGGLPAEWAHELGLHSFHIPPSISLTIILGILSASVAASLLIPEKEKQPSSEHPKPENENPETAIGFGEQAQAK
ncbi:MAG: TerC family protein [Chloroflexota bacterium]